MSALGDVIVAALEEFLRLLVRPVEDVIESNGDALLDVIVGTPHPNAVFAPPTNDAWPRLYEYYWDTIIPLSLLLWALMIGLVIFFESTSHLFSSYHRTKLKKRAFAGLLGVLSWWWMAAISLRFVDALAGFLVPNLSDVSLFQTLSFSTMGVLGIAIALLSDFVLFVLVALIYFARHVILYLFVLLMPLLIVFWVPGVGPFTLVSRFMQRLAGFYVPFLFMTVPIALLFRLGGLLGESFSLSMGGLGAWLTALVIPIVAVASPFVLFWQAGALFFMADRAATHTSAERARTRMHRVQATGQSTRHGARNFLRGTRGELAVTQSGQQLLGSGDSRAHAAGSRLPRWNPNSRGGFQGKRGGSTDDGGPDEGGRSDDFETLRDRNDSNPRRDRSNPDDDGDDDRPRYIQ